MLQIKIEARQQHLHPEFNLRDASSAAGGSDPQQPAAAKPYALPKLLPQDLPIDYAGFLAVVFGVVGVMLRVCSWIAIIFCAWAFLEDRFLRVTCHGSWTRCAPSSSPASSSHAASWHSSSRACRCCRGRHLGVR
ncbi:unnamed protein product [Urochloa humidicola]